MREVFVCPPEKRSKSGSVYRLQFDTTGRELVAWVAGRGGPFARTVGLFAHDLAAGTSRPVLTDAWFKAWGEVAWPVAVSPDLRFAAAGIDPDDGESDCFVQFEDLREPDVRLPGLDFSPSIAGELLFTPDGVALVTLQEQREGDGCEATVTRFDLTAFTKPGRQFQRSKDPITGDPVRVLQVRPRWKSVVALPEGEPFAAALSLDGRLLAVGTGDTTVHVVDRKRKKLVASLPWDGRKLGGTAVMGLALDPAAERVVMIANNRLFGRPFGATGGKAWAAKPALGDVHHLAFHPDGRVLCAVFGDGCTRFIDPSTGAVTQEFRWKRGPLHSVCFAPDGLTCAVGASSGRAILWDVD